MADLSQDKGLKNTLAQIKKDFGEGAIMQLGDHWTQDIQGISTGSLSIDIALGGKGLPRGRIIEIFGPEASGKTTVQKSNPAWAPLSTGLLERHRLPNSGITPLPHES